MDNRHFFDKLHTDIATKYGITIHDVSMIRSFALGEKFIREDIMDWLDNKARSYKRGETIPTYVKPLFTFLEELSDEAWDDITRKTEFDK